MIIVIVEEEVNTEDEQNTQPKAKPSLMLSKGAVRELLHGQY